MRQTCIRASAVVVSAAVMVLAQSYTAVWWLVCFGLVPLFLVLPRRGFLQTWLWLGLFTALYTFGTSHWIRLTGPGFEWFLLAAILYQVAWSALPAAGAAIAERSRLQSGALLWVPMLWTAAELLSRRLLFGVSWALVGLPLVESEPISQLASVAAPESLTFLALTLNMAIAMKLRKFAPRERDLAAVEAAALAGVALVFGCFRVLDRPAPSTIQVGIVQPLISQEIRWDQRNNRPPLLARLNRLIDRAATASPSLIVLPEGVLPGLVRFESDLAGFATGAVVRTRIPLLFGSIDQDDQHDLYNVAIHIGTDDTVDQYRKRRLVPFAEYTPWPFHYTPADGRVQFTPGDDQPPISIGGGQSLAVMMCLEDTYPDLAREYALAGADFLVSMVNTEEFRNTNQPLAHLRRARLTAIASGLPMVRAANSGFSASIDSRGRVLHFLPPNREEGSTIDVSIVRSPTVYQFLGDGGVFLILLAVSLIRVVWLWPELRNEANAGPSQRETGTRPADSPTPA